MKNEVKIMAIGGVRENGKNMYAIDINGGIYILDCGLKYPENELLGIDVVIPDFSYLKENKDRIVGVFLTHGHADAIGAISYFLSEFDVPVFGSQMTIELAKLNVADSEQLHDFDDFHIVSERSEIDFDDVKVTFFKTTHSIPGSLGIALHTAEGVVVYTGDFKFDQTAAPLYQTNYSALTRLGDEGVLALLSDSGNAENPAASASEKKIGAYITETFHYHDSRIVVASVASNILRMQQVFNAAAETGRRVFLTGHDLERIVKTALRLHTLKLPVDDLLIDSVKELNQLPADKVVIIQTGKMGEPIKAIQRMANKEQGDINIEPNDLVFITTTPSTAMETTVAKTRDMVYRADGEVEMISDQMNSSGDASQTDLQLIMNLLKPKFLIPVSGEYRLLEAHAQLAKQVGFTDDRIFIPDKGDIVSVNKDEMWISGSAPVADTMIDGIGIGDIGNIVLRDRKVLSEDGIFVAVVTIDRKKKRIVSQPKLTSRGFVYVKANKNLMAEAAGIIEKTVRSNLDHKEFDWSNLKQDVRETLSDYLYKQTKRRPVILPVIMEVNQHHKRVNKKHAKRTAKSAVKEQK
ncbi:ribonuclease J [Lentilactobacillus farraginis]|uniref:Ribonuclease J n=1 Tax=Lentilactobacillus farraginis DSM 18382 = JCM 14108 TaxID=1423743 RepID=X0QAS9_9LACO|nr:ribonuclease J [Lentilactobacillus farraginis]KRM01068.1 metallo-beta-lactamase superfamily hydrolase [Lentilactobacillus farraginis DSM 18382 = JCM 14108]GAF35715.1 Zn-dependent hydrolase [Lentilactobacillus farraginis DSM 18382 = JCM 14108]